MDASRYIHRGAFTLAILLMRLKHFATWGMHLMSDCKKPSDTYWISSNLTAAGAAINSALAEALKQSIQIPFQRLPP
ncbi:hypothetical protein KL86CLO1_10005 [uncultured Eubacteriales bacterium]|uniref:Uncharacterized protein n=1 Tax=uncultured Eubacteriales bacterium TaxID=172733 RepID=A0A212ITT3_9FIRM|nr:hypothetical protein KL86CLO1_10005 [uncultured Eubacteriales bacterium]